jgi:alpha-galactosidase
MLEIDDLFEAIRAGREIPFSFRLGGRPATLTLAEADRDGDVAELRYTVADSTLTASLRIERDPAFSRLCWTTTLHAAEAMEARVSTVRIGDVRIDHADPDEPTTLRSFAGGSAKHYTNHAFPSEMFRIHDRPMRGHDIHRAYDDTGRGSNEFVPLWLFDGADGGVWFGPCWQGTWNLELHRLPEYSSILCSLPFLDFRMDAGEDVTLPAFVLGAYQGDLQDGCNQLRRTILHRYLPEVEGAPPRPEVVYQLLGAHPDYHSYPTVYDEVERAARLGCKAFTYSSFWQFNKGFKDGGLQWWDLMGNYTPGENRFPGGTGALAEYLRERDMDLGLWIDPRVGLQSPALDEQRDVLLFFDDAWEAEARKKYNPISHEINIQPLLDLTRPEGRACLAGHLERMVTECGARKIWYDLNDDPYFYQLAQHEQQDRRGLMELRYFQGMDEVMENFLERHPDVWVEMCASGGRIINLAVLRYSHSFWITDYTGPDPDIAVSIRSGVNAFLPAVCNHQSFYIHEDHKPEDAEIPLHYLTAHFPGVFGISQNLIHYPEHALAALEQAGRIWMELRDALEGDYYLLAPQATGRDGWEIMQFHNADVGQGAVLLQQLSECTQQNFTLVLRGLPDDAVPRVSVLAGDVDLRAEGGTLRLHLNQDRACVLRYTMD